ncbi:MAG: DNA polymerase III subunit gamma/tau [Bacilli bacterium]|jgi:DNA polymerase-3 subunit gamma/tau|nr:DNA polymerase III subunit gamma/tau [Bacilli bacterium]
MSYKSLYLTYRPQTFEEVAGQKPIVRTLKNALSSGKIAHAFLFAGPRGTGKTTMARLLAKALNCEKGIGQQCNECENCLAISEGSHPDVVEIDAASNNGVDQVRDLIEKVKYAPIKGRYKVYIIDEVHMMSAGAFNALLKTLEEPPENVVFILCTTEPYKVLPTILSRCQRFDFSKLSDEDMKGKLIEVLTKEKAAYDEEGLKAVIGLADGGMRDALSILEQTLAYSGNKLNASDVLDLYGLASMDEKIALIEAVGDGDVPTLIRKCDDFVAGGIDIRRLTGDLIGILKDLLIYEKTKDSSLMDDLSEKQANDLSKRLPPSKTSNFIGTLIEAQNNFRNISDVRGLFELSMLRLATQEPKESPAHVAAEPKPTPKPAERSRPIEQEPKEEPAPAPSVAPEPKAADPAPEEKKAESVEEAWQKPEPSPMQKTFVKPLGPLPVVNTKKKAFETPPDFLFEDEKPTEKELPAIDTSKILNPDLANVGEAYAIPDKEIVEIMVLGTKYKKDRIALRNEWGRFDALKIDPKYGGLATLVSSGHPLVLCKEAILLSYNFKSLKEKANIKANQKPLSDLLSSVIGRKLFVYALDRNDVNRVQVAFTSLQQVGKLPRISDIKLDLPKEE